MCHQWHFDVQQFWTAFLQAEVPHTWKRWMTSQIGYLKLRVSQKYFVWYPGLWDKESRLYFFFYNFIFSSSEPKAHWWAYRVGRPPSSVFLNIFSSETTGPIKSQISYGASLGWGNESLFKRSRASMPIYGKNLKKSSSLEPKGQWLWNDLGLTLTYFTARSNLVPYAFVWEKGKKWIFQKLL